MLRQLRTSNNAAAAGQRWANEYVSASTAIRPAVRWEEEYLEKQLPSMTNLASEYLERFQKLQLTSSAGLADAWIDDYLQTTDTNKEDTAIRNFDHYEEEWRKIQEEQAKYKFASENPYGTESTHELLNSAKSELASGNVSNAILLYEAYLQQNPLDSKVFLP